MSGWWFQFAVSTTRDSLYTTPASQLFKSRDRMGWYSLCVHMVQFVRSHSQPVTLLTAVLRTVLGWPADICADVKIILPESGTRIGHICCNCMATLSLTLVMHTL